jgi:hypothetical protein
VGWPRFDPAGVRIGAVATCYTAGDSTTIGVLDVTMVIVACSFDGAAWRGRQGAARLWMRLGGKHRHHLHRSHLFTSHHGCGCRRWSSASRTGSWRVTTTKT